MLEDTLDSTLISGLWIARTKSGKKYYVTDRKKIEVKSVTRDVDGKLVTEPTYFVCPILDEDLAEVDRKKAVTIYQSDWDGPQEPQPSPQKAFATLARNRLDESKKAKSKDWETFYLRLAASLQEQKDCDPIVQGKLLKLLLEEAAACTPFAEDAINKNFLGTLRRLTFDAAWMNPDDDAANRLRTRIAENLSHIGSVAALVAQIRHQLDGVTAALEPRLPSGAILRQRGQAVLSPGCTGTLYVLWAQEGSKPSFTRIGQAKDGKASLDTTAAVYPCGCMIFCGK